jgi:transposase
LHSDVTRVAVEGAYAEAPSATADGRPLAHITHGYSGKEDPRRKQLTVSLSVSADGAVPAWYQVGDGNAADTQTYLARPGDVIRFWAVDGGTWIQTVNDTP